MYWVSVRCASGSATSKNGERPRDSYHSAFVAPTGSDGMANGSLVITTVVARSPARSRPSPNEARPNRVLPLPSPILRAC